MPTACIHQRDCLIHLKSERLKVWGRNPASGADEILREIPIRDTERLILAESVQITSHALSALLRADTPVSILGWNGQYLGGFLPATNADGLARLRQYKQTLDPVFALQMAGRIVTAKLYNQRRVLQRLVASREDTRKPSHSSGDDSPLPVGEGVIENRISDIKRTLFWLDSLFASVSRSQSIDEVRGYEGASTARYLQAWAAFLPGDFPFERRSTSPPLNAVNACISFGATLLCNEAVAFVHAHGLDPSLGLLHSTENGRWSLALDLIEPFRPLVEALTLDLFSHQMLNQTHFEPRSGGVYLNDDGRKKFILQYERRMERQFLSECAGHRTNLRQQLENQAVMYKGGLEQQEKFEPFLIN